MFGAKKVWLQWITMELFESLLDDHFLKNAVCACSLLSLLDEHAQYSYITNLSNLPKKRNCGNALPATTHNP